MKKLIAGLLIALVSGSQALCTELPFGKGLKASVVFKEHSRPAEHYPHVLLVYLHLENVHASEVSWECDPVNDIEAELLDAKGNAVPRPPSAASVMSGPKIYALPPRSQFDWLLSHGGISMMGNLRDNVALIVGGTGWLVPKDSLSSYSLRLRIKGSSWISPEGRPSRPGSDVLFEIPPATIVIR